MPAVTPALVLLADLALRRAMPTIRISEAVPLVAMMDAAGLTRYDKLQTPPSEH